MAIIKDYSDEELQEELDRRAEAKRKLAVPIPIPIDNPDWSKVKEMVVGEVNRINEEEYSDEDFEQYCFEAVMTTVFGPKFFDWYNKKVQ